MGKRKGPQNLNMLASSASEDVITARHVEEALQSDYETKAREAISKGERILHKARKSVKDHQNDSLVLFTKQKYGKEWTGGGDFTKRAQKHELQMDILLKGYEKQKESFRDNKMLAEEYSHLTGLTPVFENAFHRRDLVFMIEAHDEAKEVAYGLEDKVYDKAFKDVPREDKQRLLKRISSYLTAPTISNIMSTRGYLLRNPNSDYFNDYYKTQLVNYKARHSYYYRWLWDDESYPPEDIAEWTADLPPPKNFGQAHNQRLENLVYRDLEAI